VPKARSSLTLAVLLVVPEEPRFRYVASDRAVMGSMKNAVVALRAASRAYFHTLPSRRALTVMGSNAASFTVFPAEAGCGRRRPPYVSNHYRLATSLRFEYHHRQPEVNPVPVLQFRAARVAMHFLAHAVAHDPRAALGQIRFSARIPASALAKS